MSAQAFHTTESDSVRAEKIEAAEKKLSEISAKILKSRFYAIIVASYSIREYMLLFI
jgi:hypothetical protein